MKKVLLLCALLVVMVAKGQVRWDGGGADLEWMNPLNWAGDMLPELNDDVLLDNSVVNAGYLVRFAAGTGSVVVKSIRISPSTGMQISVVIPESSKAVPAISCSGPGYGLRIDAGGIFINSSGAAAGPTVSFSDSVRISNGGLYIHRTERAHAATVSILSRLPGTESGVFEFDVPGTAGYTVSGSNRVYGSLHLSASNHSAGRSYLLSGSNPLSIRGNLKIDSNVSATLDFSAIADVHGDIIQEGTLDLADKTRLCLRSAFINNGLITETGNGIPLLEFCGKTQQNLSGIGAITNEVGLRVNNVAGITLHDSLALPHALEMLQGRINTNDTAMLILKKNCKVAADSNSSASFVNGPMIKDSLGGQEFLLPVGAGITQRWIAVRDFYGRCKVRFLKANPHGLSNSIGAGIHHISSIEYWELEAITELPQSFKTILSFHDALSGGVTDLASLRVAKLSGGQWISAGNTLTKGSAGGSGNVQSDFINANGAIQLTLASSDASHNALPHHEVADTSKNPQRTVAMKILQTAGDMITIELYAKKKKSIAISLHTMSGQLLARYHRNVDKHVNKIYLQLPVLIRGIYLLSVANKNNEMITCRFFKQ